MADDYFVFEKGVVLLCQCLPPCRLPFKDETGAWSLVGCLLPKEHEGEHSADAPHGGFAYRNPQSSQGMRVVMRQSQPGGVYRGTCPRCLREYAMAVTSFSGETAAIVAAGTDAPPDFNNDPSVPITYGAVRAVDPN